MIQRSSYSSTRRSYCSYTSLNYHIFLCRLTKGFVLKYQPWKLLINVKTVGVTLNLIYHIDKVIFRNRFIWIIYLLKYINFYRSLDERHTKIQLSRIEILQKKRTIHHSRSSRPRLEINRYQELPQVSCFVRELCIMI